MGAIEPQFYAALLTGLELDPNDLPAQMDQSTWTDINKQFAEIFRSRSRADWEQVFGGTDACVTSVLDFDEAAANTHLRERGALIEIDGVVQAGVAPRFSRSAPDVPKAPTTPGSSTDEVRADWGIQ